MKKRNPGGCEHCCGPAGLLGSSFGLFSQVDPTKSPTWHWDSYSINWGWSHQLIGPTVAWGNYGIGYDHIGLKREVFGTLAKASGPTALFALGNYPIGSVVIFSMRDILRTPASTNPDWRSSQIPKFTRIGANYNTILGHVGSYAGAAGTWVSSGVDYDTRRLYGFAQYFNGTSFFWRIGSCAVDDGGNFQWHTPAGFLTNYLGTPDPSVAYPSHILWSRVEQRPVVFTTLPTRSGFPLVGEDHWLSYTGADRGAFGTWIGGASQTAISDFDRVFSPRGNQTVAGPSALVDADVACFTPTGPIMRSSARDLTTGITLYRPIWVRETSLYGFRLRLNGQDVCNVSKILWDEVNEVAVAIGPNFQARLDFEKATEPGYVVEASPLYLPSRANALDFSVGRSILLPRS